MKAIGYVRVSKEEQAAEGISLAMQKEKIAQYCQLHDLELVRVVEEVVSAKDVKHRPKFQRVLDDLLRNGHDALVCWRLDRCFRNVREALAAAEALDKKKKRFISVTESLDTKSAFGKFAFVLMASLAEMERNVVSERTRAALQSKKARGEKLGGDVPYGFQADATGKLTPNPQEREIISVIKSYHDQGLSSRKIAAQLNKEGTTTRKGTPWSHTLVHRVIRNAA